MSFYYDIYILYSLRLGLLVSSVSIDRDCYLYNIIKLYNTKIVPLENITSEVYNDMFLYSICLVLGWSNWQSRNTRMINKLDRRSDAQGNDLHDIN
jgi:hypothetical protein